MIGEKCMPRSRPIGLHVGGKGYEQKCSKKTELSIRWRGVVGLGFFLSALFVSSGSALIGSHSPVFRSLSSGNYTSVFPICFVRICFSLLLLARPATDHRVHTFSQ